MAIFTLLAPVLLGPATAGVLTEEPPVAADGWVEAGSAESVSPVATEAVLAAAALAGRVAAGEPESAEPESAESVVTDHDAPIYGRGPTVDLSAPESAARVLQASAGSSPGDRMVGPAPTSEGDAVPAAATSALTPLRPGLSDAQYYEALIELALPNGLVLDRNSDPHTVSSAATGLVGAALAALADRGVADRAGVAAHLRRGFETTRSANPPANRGWLSHFTHTDGTPKRNSEVSTIDTALFYGGLLRAAQTLDLADLERDVRAAVDAVDVAWLLRDGVFLHGVEWPADRPQGAPGAEPRFIPYTWDDTSEGAALYRLFGVPFRPTIHRTDLPLFTYFYPLVLWPEWDEAGSGRTGGVVWPGADDPGADSAGEVYRYEGPDYRKLLAAALSWQHRTLGHAGVTAADGPGGYTAFRPTLVSPLMLSSLAPRFPEAAHTLRTHDLDATLPAYDLDAGWDAPDRLAIDYASYFLLRAEVIEPGRLPGTGDPSLLADVE